MPVLTDYRQFDGRHPETGSICNYLAYRGVKAPHNGGPYSEALLFGISGGIVTGYFTFAYEGYDPHVALLTRNTFDPLETLLSRLGTEREFRKTNKPEKGVANLIDTLNDGVPAIVWADLWSLPYNALPYDQGMWGSIPIVVHGYEEEADEVFIADRSSVSLKLTTDELAAARGRIKKDKFQILHLDILDPDRLPAAVSSGIWDCFKLFTEKPPRGSAKNFGFAAYQNWIGLLRSPKGRQSWAKEFPVGPRMYAGLTSVVSHFGATGIGRDACRSEYADFLDEAALVLSRPNLKQVAQTFRQSAQAWRNVAEVVLPDDITPFGETRGLMAKRWQLFVERGGASLPEIIEIRDRLSEIRRTMNQGFPLNEPEAQEHRERIADALQIVHDIEREAVDHLRSIMTERV